MDHSLTDTVAEAKKSRAQPSHVEKALQRGQYFRWRIVDRKKQAEEEEEPTQMPMIPCEHCGKVGHHRCSFERWLVQGGVHELGAKHAQATQRLAHTFQWNDALALFTEVFLDENRFKSVRVSDDGRWWVRVKPSPRKWAWALVDADDSDSKRRILAIMRGALEKSHFSIRQSDDELVRDHILPRTRQLCPVQESETCLKWQESFMDSMKT